MKYLNKSFTIYPSVQRTGIILPLQNRRQKPIDPKHKFVDLGGICRWCALSKEGHNAKFPR